MNAVFNRRLDKNILPPDIAPLITIHQEITIENIAYKIFIWVWWYLYVSVCMYLRKYYRHQYIIICINLVLLVWLIKLLLAKVLKKVFYPLKQIVCL